MDANGARNKIKSIEKAARTKNAHVICIAETKSIPPRIPGYSEWHMGNKRERYDEVTTSKTGQPVTGIKQKIIQLIYQELGIKRAKYEHGFKRGAYFANIYQNGKEFLK